MIKIILITCMSLLLFACASTKQVVAMTDPPQGVPHWSGGKNVSLSLKRDRTFELYLNKQVYTGTWDKQGYSGFLRFDRMENPFFRPQEGVAFDNEKTMYFPNSYRIRIDNLTFRRSK